MLARASRVEIRRPTPFNRAMKLAQIDALIAVTNAGSIRAAALALGKTQSALTKQIRQMEDHVGLELFLRTSRGVVPTEQCLSLLKHARAVQSDVSRLNEAVSWLHGRNSGQVRVSAAPLAAIKVLPRAIARFRNSHAEVDITISSDLFGDALSALREGQVDMIVGPHDAALSASDLDVEELFSSEIAVITSKAAPHAKATSLAELTGCEWAMMGDTAGRPKSRFRAQFKQHGLEPPQIRLASESRLGLLSLVRELGVVSTFPAKLLDELGADAGVVRIPIAEPMMPLTISLITLGGRVLAPAALSFADCIRHRVGVLNREWS